MNHLVHRRDVLKLSAGAGVAMAAQRLSAFPTKPSWPFYVFDNGVASLSDMADRCRLLKDLGYEGKELSLNVQKIPGELEQLDKFGLRPFAVYAPAILEESSPNDWAWIKLFRGRDTRIQIPLRSRRLKSSDPAGDERAVDLLKTISDLCADNGPTVSVYPHTWFWTERVEDGLRLARKVQRKNVGTNFNLVHWQWVKPSPSLAALLPEAVPHLFLVTINGLKGPVDKRQEIRPLDESDYDLRSFLKLVRKSHYQGPVGLQCYKISEPPAVHLKRSMNAWRALTAAVNDD